jgi:hypothetical protein
MNNAFRNLGFCALIFVLVSCKLVDTITGSGPDMVRANEMWSDVPKMDSFTKSDLEMPTTVKLIMKTALNNLWRLNSNSEDKTPTQGDWIVFATPQTPAEVQSFYSNDKMTSFGKWDNNKASTCSDGNEAGGGFCVFAKRDGDKQTLLLIAAMTDNDKKVTHVFFLRLEGDKKTLNINSSNK